MSIATRRLRVLFVIGTMSGGGAERQVIEILRLIDRSRFEPLLYLATRTGELLTSVPSDVPIFAFRDDSPETWMQKLVRRCKLSPLARYLHLARVLRRERIDVIYDRTYHATLDAAGATWFRATPRISCCVVDPQPELEMHARRGRGLVWKIARSAYHRASLVLANSTGLRERVVEYFQLPPDHVVISRNLLDLERLDRLASEPLPTEVASEPFLLVAAGRLHAQKGYRYLLEAIDELINQRQRQLRLVILGTGLLRSELEEFARAHGLQQHVTFAGFVANPLPWFRRAKLFVLPSLFEGLPNSLLEAVACGTPALATDCPSGPSEILDKGRLGGLVAPADSRALADAIHTAMDHYPEWQQRATKARESVRQRYDASTGIRDLESLIERVAVNK
ncbi:MAG: glycosyltransferase [Schlesneria sp.]|nr:glycosyltransferase [Schlesneria sp.]